MMRAHGRYLASFWGCLVLGGGGVGALYIVLLYSFSDEGETLTAESIENILIQIPSAPLGTVMTSPDHPYQWIYVDENARLS